MCIHMYMVIVYVVFVYAYWCVNIYIHVIYCMMFMYYRRKGAGITGGYEDGAKCITGGRDRVLLVGMKPGQNVLSEEGTGCYQWIRRQEKNILSEEGTGRNRWVQRRGKMYYWRKEPS